MPGIYVLTGARAIAVTYVSVKPWLKRKWNNCLGLTCDDLYSWDMPRLLYNEKPANQQFNQFFQQKQHESGQLMLNTL